MPKFQNNAMYNKQSSLTRVSVLAMDIDPTTATNNGEIDIFTVLIPVKEALSGLMLDRMYGRKVGRTAIPLVNGELADVTNQDREFNFEVESTLTIADDALFESDKSMVEGYRNVLEAICLGETFYSNGLLYKVVGIAGNSLYQTSTGVECRKTNRDWRYLFFNDSKAIKPYTGAQIENKFLKSAALTNIHAMIEVKGTNTDGETRTKKYPGVCFYSNGLSENDDKNNVELPFRFDTDFRDYSNFMFEGFTTDEVVSDGASVVHERINVDYVIAQSGGADPTDFGTAGETACIIDTDDGTFTVKTTDGASTWTALSGGIAQGCVIWSPKFGSGATLALATATVVMVGVKTAGTAGSGTAGSQKASITTFVETTGKYHAVVKNYDFANKDFAVVTDVEELC